jgi:hypothetical protein
MRPGEDLDQACYRTKGGVMRAFVARNRFVLDEGGGIDQPATGGEFDAVNEKWRRKRKATTFREALVLAAGGTSGHYCLTAIDLPVLNETPTCHGDCQLPDAAYVQSEDEAAYYLVPVEADALNADDEDVPF